MSKPDYDTTLARMAGNIAGAFVALDVGDATEIIAKEAVALARAIVAEIKRTEPAAQLKDAADQR